METGSSLQVVEGTDRRTHPRIPFNGRVRVGRPGGPAKRQLSLSDLSLGGMFIDADRPARVGARFCAELELEDGRLFVPEAEVTYNRDRPHGSGFGARFVALGEQEVARLRQSLDDAKEAHERTLSVPPLAGDSQPTSPADDLSEVDVRIAADTPTLEIPRRGKKPQRAWHLRAREELRAAVSRFPSLWVVLMGLGAACLVAALGLVVWAEFSRAPVVQLNPPTRGMSSDTHRVLVGDEDPVALDPPVRSLPAQGNEPPPSAGRVPSPSSSKTAPALDSPDAKPSPGKAKARDRRPQARTGAPAASSSSDSGTSYRFQVGAKTRVLRSLRMKNPPRFVVDIEGLERFQAPAPALGPVQRIRFGRHDGYGRVVFDLDRPMGPGASARIVDGVLQVRLPPSG